MSEREDQPTLRRPNGSLYRPRKLAAHPVEEWNEELRIVVFGTHDIDRAKKLADQAYAAWGDSRDEVTDPRLVWWRDGFDCGQRRFVDDPEHGRAGVYFAGVRERSGGLAHDW